MRWYFWAAIVIAACHNVPGWAIDGRDLALNSGSDNGTNAQLDRNGYAGTYITVASPGDVTITVNASGTAAGGVNPRMNIVVADTKAAFDVTPSTFSDYSHTFEALPAGTYFVRTEFVNDTAVTSRSLSVGTLNVSGATVLNDNTSENALAAADTYIEHFRRGPAKVGLVGVAPGTEVNVRLKRHAFNFGTNIHGGGDTGLLNANPAPGSNAFNYQQFVNEHFNMVVPSNAGKWQFNEPQRDQISSSSMAWVDKIFQYAEDHGMRARQHNLIWGNQQPGWVNPLSDSALRAEISERIEYYVGDGDGGFPERSLKYSELDVYNESVHTGVDGPSNSYWNRYDAAGISSIFEEIAQAVATAGADTKLYLNEYNILQNGFDSYGNWYREHLEEVENGDGNPDNQTVSGIGMQLYGLNGHTASYMQQVLQNMSVTGLPQTLSEFGVQDNVFNESTVLQIVEDSMRMMFGTPDATSFMYWGWWASATSNLQSASVLVDDEWNLTATGRLYEDLLGIQDWDGDPDNGWTTDVTIPVADEGTIDFTGFYGDYELTIAGQTYDLLLSKGDALYSLVVAAGDYNADGKVDAADYTTWRNTLGSTEDLRADGNGNAVIDDGDYFVWKSLFGTAYGGGSLSGANRPANAPEPGGVLLLFAGAIMLVSGCRPRRPGYAAAAPCRTLFP